MKGSDIVRLPTLDPDTRTILHRPTGLLIIERGGNCVSGSREELLRLAAEVIAADLEEGTCPPKLSRNTRCRLKSNLRADQ